MIIDTDKMGAWAKLHLRISVPLATGALAWFAAVRWQAAIDHNQTALMVFYFFVSAFSGIATLCLTVCHLMRLGLFD